MLSKTRKNLAMAALASSLGLIALVGCKPSETSADKGPAGDVRGEPINAAKASPAPATKSETTNAVVESKPVVSAEVKAQSATAPVQKDGDYLLVGFDKLASYNFTVPDEDPATNKVTSTTGPDKADDQIPDAVKAFNKKKVSIKGFMLPLKVEGGSVTEFLIMKDQSMCCYGTVPKITEWVSVKTGGKGVKPVMDQAVNVQGTLKVGAMRENGYLVGIYEMDGERLTEAGD